MIINPEDYCYVAVTYQFLLSGNWHYSILLSLQPTYAVNAESKLCAKVRKSHLWSMNLTTGRDSSHDPALTHTMH